MKKTLSVLTILMLATSLAYADSSAYNGVQVDTTKLLSAPKTVPSDLPEVQDVQDLPEFTPPKTGKVYYDATASASTQKAKLQDALLKIDSAQVDVKNELNLYESKLVDVKNRESLVKQEKKGILRKIRAIKKKQNALDTAKKKIESNIMIEEQGKNTAKHFNWFK